MLCSVNQFIQNFLFPTHILEFLNLSKIEGDRSLAPFGTF